MRHLAGFVLLLGACGNSPKYSVQTRTVTARNEAPNVMLLVDASVSMAPHLADVKASLRKVLEAHGDRHNFGLTAMGGDVACAPPRLLVPAVAEPRDDEAFMRARAAEVRAALDGVSANGTSSLAFTLDAFVSSPGPLGQRERFVLLLTAAEPTCGGDAIGAVRALRAASVRTVIVGVGPTASSSAMLDGLARVGGLQAICPGGTDAECWLGDRCVSPVGVCARAHFPALDEAGLDGVMKALFTPLESDACSYRLEAQPASADGVTVLLDGKRVEAGADTWELQGQGIRFVGETCTKLERSTPRQPVELELRVELSP